MPAIQPIPRNAPGPSSEEATKVLALHNRSTENRSKESGPAVQRGTVRGEDPGSRVGS